MRGTTLTLAAIVSAAAALGSAAIGVATEKGKPAKNLNACEGGVKVEPVRDGTYLRTLDGEPVLITLDVDEAAQVYAFTTTSPVRVAVAKGGTGSLTYVYPGGVTTASGLHAPVNPSSGKVYGLSHVCFFDETPPPGVVVPPVEEPPVLSPPPDEPPAEEPPAEEPPAEEPPVEDPPADEPPVDEQPPAEDPPGDQPPVLEF